MHHSLYRHKTDHFTLLACARKHFMKIIEKDNSWPSTKAWCIIDMKEQTICRRYWQICKICGTKVRPRFPNHVIEKMVQCAVDSFLKRNRMERDRRVRWCCCRQGTQWKTPPGEVWQMHKRWRTLLLTCR